MNETIREYQEREAELEERLRELSGYHERLYAAAEHVYAVALPLRGESGERSQVVATRALDRLNDVLCERFIRKADDERR